MPYPKNTTPPPSGSNCTSVRGSTNTYAYPQKVYTDGKDIIVPFCIATCFGGGSDFGDDGSTASGERTDVPGGVYGVALPMPAASACRGTPFPQMPWKTLVECTLGVQKHSFYLLDEGPGRALRSGALIDLTVDAWEKMLGIPLSPRAANSIERAISFRIPGGAQFFGDYVPWCVDVSTERESGPADSGLSV